MNSLGRSLDGSIPVQALLYPDETLIASQGNIGLYDGNQKAPNHQNGSIHLTSHRLIYVDSVHPHRQSLAFALSDVRQSEYYAGFLTSSPKITLSLSSPIHPAKSADVGPGTGEAASDAGGSGDTSSTRWECEICGNKNVDTGLAPKLICQLCGVPRSSKSSAVAIAGLSKVSASTSALSQSLPVSTSPNVLRAPSAPPIENNDDDNGIPCPACTFINHPSLRNCELCNTSLPKRTRIPNKSAPSSRPPSPTLEDHTPVGGDAVIKVSFRGGSDRAFHAALKRVLIAKAWVVDVPNTKAAPAGGSKSGIHGIVETLRSEATTKTSYMQSSLQDLESLMSQANAMVQQAKALGLSLAQAQSQPYSNVQLPEEAQFIISTSMARLGLIPDAVTPDMIKDDERYTEELAKELGGFLTGTIGAGGGKGKQGMMDDRGLVGLDEIWGGWNRARGVALIPPSSFMQVLPRLSAHTDPMIKMRTFKSGLKVLHTPWYAHKEFSERLLVLLEAAGPKTLMEVAEQENVSVGLAGEMIASVEDDGRIVRDDAGRGDLRWWTNELISYEWDGD